MDQQVGGHLQRAVDDDIEGQLLGPGGLDAAGAARVHAEDAGRIVHRPGQQAGEDQIGLMLRRVARLAPGAELHAARALARDHVRIGAAQARVLERLVGIDGHLVTGRRLDDLHVVLGQRLALMEGKDHVAVRPGHARAASIGDIARLDRVLAQALHLRHGRFQLLLIAIGIAARFVVRDQLDALVAGIGGDAFQVEVGIGPGEVELFAAGEPVAVPAQVPAFDQHPAKAVLGRKIDMLDSVLGRCAMLGSRVPGLQLQVHFPPDADVLHRLDPADVAQAVRLVQVQDQAGFRQACGAVADLQGAPGRVERSLSDHGGIGQAGRQLGSEAGAFRAAQVHPRIVDQGGFVDRDVGAGLAAHGDRGLGAADRADRGAVVEVFLAVPFPGGDPPRLAVLGQVKLGQFRSDTDGLQRGLVGELVAEGDAVVIQANQDIETALQAGFLDIGHAPLVVVVAHEAALAPRLLPGIIHQDRLAGRHGKVALQHRDVGQQEAHP